MKKLFKKFSNKSLGFKVSVTFIPIVIIILLVIIFILWKKDYEINPSNADIELGIKKTYGNFDNMDCDFYTNVIYGTKKYTKYECNFNLNDEKKHTCVVCEVKNSKYMCSISSINCYK